MRWRGEQESDNVEDQRGIGAGGVAIGGIGTVILVVIGLALGVDPRALLQQVQQAQPNNPQQQAPRPRDPAEEERVQFVKVVLKSTEDVWTDLFRQMGRQYRQPKLHLFTGRVNSACGLASAATGPFYCPSDEKVYIDLSFFQELKRRFGAPGEFAQAYVISHEIGHHVQKLMGVMDQVHRLEQNASKEKANQYSVRLELQADFLAGVWAHHAQKTRHWMDPGDIESAIGAATAIGDDMLQKQAQGYVVPESFTHGTSAQRVRWFRKGFDTGDISQGDTFKANNL